MTPDNRSYPHASDRERVSVNKKATVAAVTCVVLLSLPLSGCSTEAEEPNNESAATSNYTPTSADKLNALAIGETAVWRDYEVTLKSIERANNVLTARIEVKAHTLSKNLSTECLLSFGMPPSSSSFDGDTITIPANESVSGTLTFDDRYESQRLFWNDGAIEATWQLDLTPAQSDESKNNNAKTQSSSSAKTVDSKTDQSQKQAIAALEAEMPSLFTNNTAYEFKSVDVTTATVTPHEGGGYEYTNTVSIIDKNGNPNTVNTRLICEANGNCISMTVNDTLLF